MHELLYLYHTIWRKGPFCIKRNQQKNTNEEKCVDLITVDKFLKKMCKYVQADLPSVMLSNGTRENGHRLRHKTLSLSTRKHFFLLRVIKQWCRSAREGLDLCPLRY